MKRLSFLALAGVFAAVFTAPPGAYAEAEQGNRPLVDSAAPQADGPRGTPADRDFVNRVLAAPMRQAPAPEGGKRGLRSGPPRLSADAFGYSGMSAGGKPVRAAAPDGMDELIAGHNALAPQPEAARTRSARPRGKGESSQAPRRPGDRKVIGSDERVRVYETDKYPFSAFGFIYSEYPGGVGGRCTGTVIGPKLVLTAAHCIFDAETGNYARRVVFLPGMSGKTAPFGYFEASSWAAPTGYQAPSDRTGPRFIYDIAVIRFEETIAKRTGSLGYGYSESLPPFHANIIGYPADIEGRFMWRADCRVEGDSIYRSYIDHTCDTYGGSSGSAVYELTPDDRRIIHGVHTRGGRNSNAGVRMTRPHFEWIRNYR